MDFRIYRAQTMHEALTLVRRDLGPEASVLRTREVRPAGMLPWLRGVRLIEVTASAAISVPSRLPARAGSADLAPKAENVSGIDLASVSAVERDLRAQLSDLQSLVDGLCRRGPVAGGPELPDSLFGLFTDLIEAEVPEHDARQLIDDLRRQSADGELSDREHVKSLLAQALEELFRAAGPIKLTPGKRHLVALVGPTGVGKTTTIAKLAANYRLKEKRRVGLITVDTYRIAAVEQLRTYADIIDLPMEVVSTPREMRQAVARLSDLDLVLLDTAGRSPRDEVKIQELKSLLAEAQPDEVHLVLSAVSGAAALTKTAQRFADVGTTALLVTKLDEATGLGNLVPLMRGSKLPLSYLTHGQNVPDDIEAADAQRLTRLLLASDASAKS